VTDEGDTPRILVSNRQSMAVDEPALAALARECLVGERLRRSELSVSFVTADEIADLHDTYMHEEGATDVLSFPLDDDDRDEAGVRLLGDVVIAPEVAALNNPEDPAGELRLLLVHGILHLLGHDHDDEADRREMWTIQERYTGVRVP
jgi:probable rRNA maturation factor